jgi:hypothetical protein
LNFIIAVNRRNNENINKMFESISCRRLMNPKVPLPFRFKKMASLPDVDGDAADALLADIGAPPEHEPATVVSDQGATRPADSVVLFASPGVQSPAALELVTDGTEPFLASKFSCE